MPIHHVTTRYAAISTRSAWLVLALLVAAIDWCLLSAEALPRLDIHELGFSLGDGILYKRVAARVGSGENYYDVASEELSFAGYDRDSIFYWRLPSYSWILGRLPSETWARALLISCAVACLFASFAVIGHEDGWIYGVAVAASLCISCGGWFFHAEPAYFMELWVSVILSLALLLRSVGLTAWAVVAAGIALSLRELTLLFCTLWCVKSCSHHRYREAFSWSGLILVFLLFYFHHYHQVGLRFVGVSRSSGLGWVTFGGTKFVLSCCRMAYPLMILPSWATAIYAPVALLGLFGWSSRTAGFFQSSLAVYLLLFAFVGKPINFYWGWIITPWLAMGAAWSPLAIRDLIRATTR
jgi:hypothetical protein